MDSKEVFKKLKEILNPCLVEITEDEGLIFENFVSNGYKVDGEFWFYPDEVTYTLYFVKNKKEYGPFQGRLHYTDDTINDCTSLMEANFVIL